MTGPRHLCRNGFLEVVEPLEGWILFCCGLLLVSALRLSWFDRTMWEACRLMAERYRIASQSCCTQSRGTHASRAKGPGLARISAAPTKVCKHNTHRWICMYCICFCGVIRLDVPRFQDTHCSQDEVAMARSVPPPASRRLCSWASLSDSRRMWSTAFRDYATSACSWTAHLSVNNQHVSKYQGDDQDNDPACLSHRGPNCCSWAAFVAHGPQKLDILISHSWSGYVNDVLKTIEHFCRGRGLGINIVLWICTFTERQRGEHFGSRLEYCPFISALKAVDCTLREHLGQTWSAKLVILPSCALCQRFEALEHGRAQPSQSIACNCGSKSVMVAESHTV